MHLKRKEWEAVGQIPVVYNVDIWSVVEKAVMNLQVP